MILSQLLHAASKVEPLKRGQTSHSLGSVVKRELGLELYKISKFIANFIGLCKNGPCALRERQSRLALRDRCGGRSSNRHQLSQAQKGGARR